MTLTPIFRTTKLQNIIGRLIYEDENHTVVDNLSDCNVGSRKKLNIHDASLDEERLEALYREMNPGDYV